MRRDFIKFFKAMMLLMIFILSLLPEAIIIKQLGLTFRADTLILWMAGIEAVDAWDEYEREKNNYKKYRRSKVIVNGKNKKETSLGFGKDNVTVYELYCGSIYVWSRRWISKFITANIRTVQYYLNEDT